MTWRKEKSWADRWINVSAIPGGSQGMSFVARRKEAADDQSFFFLKRLRNQTSLRARNRFEIEAVAYSQLQHLRLPRFIESNAHLAADRSTQLYIVTELISGVSLADKINRDGPLAFDDAVALVLALCDVVEYLHAEGYVHRDIKPQNIILRGCAAADPVLIDFGISFTAERESEALTGTGEEIGPRFFRLPEFAPGSPAKQDTRSDIALVAAILFYVLTGLSPSVPIDEEGRSPHQRAAARPLLQSAAGHRSISLLLMFDKAMASNIHHRFAKVSELRDAIIKMRDAVSSSDLDPEALEREIRELANGVANRGIARNRSITQRAVNEVISMASDLVNRNARDLYTTINAGSSQSNTSSMSIYGYCHAGNHERRFLPTIQSMVVGSELVMTIGEDEVLRTDAIEPNFDEQFRQRVARIYLTGLKSLFEDE